MTDHDDPATPAAQSCACTACVQADARALVERLGPPKTGKTAFLGPWVLDDPGPAVTTTSRVDVFKVTDPEGGEVR